MRFLCTYSIIKFTKLWFICELARMTPNDIEKCKNCVDFLKKSDIIIKVQKIVYI